MNGFDLALVTVVALSALFAFVRGVIRELIALATWVIGFVVAIEYAGPLAGMFARLDMAPVAKQALAFAVILIAVMIAGAIVSRLLTGVVRAIGLGFVDRTLGAAFGGDLFRTGGSDTGAGHEAVQVAAGMAPFRSSVTSRVDSTACPMIFMVVTSSSG